MLVPVLSPPALFAPALRQLLSSHPCISEAARSQSICSGSVFLLHVNLAWETVPLPRLLSHRAVCLKPTRAPVVVSGL